MSGKRYPEEFKIEAVKQVTERGHAATEVAARLGVSSHSLYQWVKRYSVPPAERQKVDDQQAEMSCGHGPVDTLRSAVEFGRCGESSGVCDTLQLDFAVVHPAKIDAKGAKTSMTSIRAAVMTAKAPRWRRSRGAPLLNRERTHRGRLSM